MHDAVYPHGTMETSSISNTHDEYRAHTSARKYCLYRLHREYLRKSCAPKHVYTRDRMMRTTCIFKHLSYTYVVSVGSSISVLLCQGLARNVASRPVRLGRLASSLCHSLRRTSTSMPAGWRSWPMHTVWSEARSRRCLGLPMFA